MYTRKATVTASVGLHARPAAVFVRAVNKTGLPITLAKEGMAPIDGRSLLEVMTADFMCGSEVEISVRDGEHDDGAVRAAVDLLAALLVTDLTDPS
ncbi:phosphocarrier protein [Arthrobacter silviterrae]|uniref:Phosphocarrier protein HPr n=1 Tax=Arthrobacter silviterrae TaxID=2026658 RepID=A0ABX0DLP8_9MICC|nr:MULTISPECIES: HPr family phosphocarrier protein [Arthrobacter]MCU6481552.1 HPr family phosphocarrier protein [Arthrobacter sp. A2-55]MDQ0276246.1 phosphocarrier protein [Arthrobacter silviterrae]NGN85173.1 HPr family phosphocarrier protein [Arthrobacter silviterrae]